MTPHDILEQRVSALEKEIPTIKSEITRNTDITAAIKSDTEDLVDFVKAIGGLIPVARLLGRVVQWLAPIALVLVSAWSVFKDKKL